MAFFQKNHFFEQVGTLAFTVLWLALDGSLSTSLNNSAFISGSSSRKNKEHVSLFASSKTKIVAQSYQL